MVCVGQESNQYICYTVVYEFLNNNMNILSSTTTVISQMSFFMVLKLLVWPAKPCPTPMNTVYCVYWSICTFTQDGQTDMASLWLNSWDSSHFH